MSNTVEVELVTGARVLFSYGVPVAAFLPEQRWVKTAQRYSVTTSKHANAFLAGHPYTVLEDTAFRAAILPLTRAK